MVFFPNDLICLREHHFEVKCAPPESKHIVYTVIFASVEQLMGPINIQTILKLYELAEQTAKCNGVFPSESCLFGFAPRVNKIFTISLYPVTMNKTISTQLWIENLQQ